MLPELARLLLDPTVAVPAGGYLRHPLSPTAKRRTGRQLGMHEVLTGRRPFAADGLVAVIGAYVADEGATRSKGALYFALHPHGQEGRGRWVGLSHDGPIVSGWAAMAKTEEAVAGIMEELRTGTDPRTGNARP